MAIQAIATGLVHKQAPASRTIEGVEHKEYKLIHAGIKEPITINALTPVGSQADTSLGALQKASAAAAEKGEKQVHRVLISGTNGTLNVNPSVEPDGAVDGSKTRTTTGVVHKANAVDLLVTSARQVITDPRIEPEQFTVTVIGNCEADYFSGTLKSVDGLQCPIQLGQDDAYHLRIIPQNDAVKAVLMGVGDQGSDNYVAPQEGMYFLSGSFVRESAAGQNADAKSKAIPAWDRIAMQVTSAMPLQIQDQKSQRNVNANNALQTPDVNAYNAATSSENAASDFDFGSDVSNLLD